jgi:hypothetical protein
MVSFLCKLEPEGTMLATSQRITHGWLVLIPQLKKAQRSRPNAPQASFHPTAKENEMKLQILDEGLDSNREGENYFIF